MTRLLERYKVLLPILAVLLVSTGCSKHEQMIFMYTFTFILIFVVLCIPSIVLSAVARGNGSRSARTTGIVFASVGGFFAIIYTMNMFNEVRRIDDELILYLLLMWAALLGSLVLLVVPNPKIAERDRRDAMQYQQYHQQGQVFTSEEEILQYADHIREQKAAEPTVENSNYLNDDLSDQQDQQKGPDMSGLDDLSDL